MVAVHQTFQFLLRPWSVFFLVVCTAIVTTMMLPAVFGMELFTQWGAMYTDSWCSVRVYDGDPLKPETHTMNVTAGITDTSPVWSAPMHNEETCTMYARNILCGQKSTEGWTIVWARPFFKGKYFLDPQNVCDLTLGSYEWFSPVPAVVR